MAVNKDAVMAQMMIHQAYVTHFQTRILSGAYKSRTVQGRLMTESQLLHDELETQLNHIKRMNDCMETLYDS